MECFAGVAAGGFAAKEAYQYNRENFLYDRNLRRRKEFQVQKFRVEQAELWRTDVRDLISLTEYKMHVYLLVNVLLLGITVALWCQGKLPHTTPVWLMTGNALSMAGSFSFILLSIWMAMHAAVSAQAFETRLLTQMVRLPIPSWQEVEACRTYASEFERLDAKQMFRIPFVTGKQESWVPPDPGVEGEETPSTRSRRLLAETHVDPWGLEGTGSNVPELGARMGHGMHKYRHVKLARQAMAFWQSYDAFARICMSIGVNQLLNAASYFILAYYMTEAKVPSSETYGVVVLTTMAETLNRLDMSLNWWQLRLMQLFLYLGPAIATMAGWAWVEDGWELTAEALVVCAFLANALYLLTVNTLCHMHLEHNGAMLPSVFRSVLYLDVFGWSSQARYHREFSPRVSTPMTTESSPGGISARGPAALAMTKPASAMVQHSLGRPVPRRPELAAAPADFQDAPGAPDVGEHGDNPVTGFSEFYKAEGWLSTTNDIPDEDDIVSGCEHQGAIKLPRQTFSCAMNLLCLAWIIAAFYFAFVISKATLVQKHAFFERTRPGLRDRHLPSLLGLMEVEEHLATEDLLRVSWPHENVLPQAFACDADGRQFVVSDGLSLFNARLQTPLEPKAPLIAKFSEAAIPCLPGESLVDATVRCDTATADRCEALVLHRSGRRLSSCHLGNGTKMSHADAQGREISDAWLEELRSPAGASSRAPHARVEKAVTLTSQAHCTGDNCILLGTSRGRLVRLGMSSSSKLTPTHAVLDRDPHESEYWEPGSVRAVGADHVAVLAQNGTRLHIHSNDGRLAGHLVLSEAAQGFCASGQHLYFLDMGPSPKIWRLRMPQMDLRGMELLM